MAKREARWVRVRHLGADEKATVSAACERVVAEHLKPLHLPDIHPTPYNYPIDIFGRWRGSKYSFVTRFRSGFADTAGAEFDVAFARLDHLDELVSETRFDVMWHRHTGQWWPLHRAVTLEEALRLIVTDPVLRPPV